MSVPGVFQVNKGSLNRIFNSDNDPDNALAQPIVQCVQIKPLQQAGNQDRYRVVFSDTVNFVQSMLATQANHYIQSGKLVRGCFVRLKSFQANSINNKRIIIVLDLEVLTELGVCEKVGEPVALDLKTESSGKPQPTTISANGFYGNRPEVKQESPQKSLPSRSMNSAAHGNIYPIEGVSPWSNKWTIKARVTNKSEIKTWHNKNGEGKLFSVNLLDESGEIKATGFNNECDAFYERFQEGAVYYISSPCRVQLAKKQFSNLANDYEITFEANTEIVKADEQDGVPQVRFHFTSIEELQNVEKDAVIDTIGILKEIGDRDQIVSKTTSKPYDKRELTIVDNTNFSVRVTIWGNTAANFDVGVESIVAFKGVKVSDFGGRSLSLLSSGSMAVNPDVEEAHKLRGWYDGMGRNETFSNHEAMRAAGAAGGRGDAFKTASQVKEENLGMSETVDYFAMKGTVLYIKNASNVSYPACPSNTEPKCNKKVVEMEDGQWRCEKCDKAFPRPEYRYILSIGVTDHTGQIWLSCFDDVGQMIMGVTANELEELKAKEDKSDEAVFQKASCQSFIFRCRAKMDNYRDEQRVRYQVSSASPVNFVSESAKLMSLIKLYD